MEEEFVAFNPANLTAQEEESALQDLEKEGWVRGGKDHKGRWVLKRTKENR